MTTTDAGSTPRRWTTTAGAMAHLHCSDRTLERYVARGLITRYRLAGHLLRYDLDQLDALIVAEAVAEAVAGARTA